MSNEQSNAINEKKPSHGAFRHRVQQGWDCLVAQDWMDYAPLQNLDDWMADKSHALVKDVPCRIILKTETPQGVVYTKYMRAQNDGVIKKNEWFSKLKWILEPSRGQRIFKTTSAMLERGHACPVPVLGARRRGAYGYPHEIFIAREITLPTAEDVFKESDDNAQTALVRFCGKKLALLHKDNFIHGDFLPRNVCPDIANDSLVFLDNDRTKHHRLPMPFFLKRRNLAQFAFNLYLLSEQPVERLVESLVDAYAETLAWPGQRQKHERQTVLRQVNRRWEKTKHYELRLKHNLKK